MSPDSSGFFIMNSTALRRALTTPRMNFSCSFIWLVRATPTTLLIGGSTSLATAMARNLSLYFDHSGSVIGVLLTGMGSDGAEGLLALRRAGHPTIAQDEASSVVYGMPKAAAELGAAGAILPIEKIAERIGELSKRTAP